jgi:hypothetical protein
MITDDINSIMKQSYLAKYSIRKTAAPKTLAPRACSFDARCRKCIITTCSLREGDHSLLHKLCGSGTAAAVLHCLACIWIAVVPGPLSNLVSLATCTLPAPHVDLLMLGMQLQLPVQAIQTFHPWKAAMGARQLQISP